MTTTLPDVKNLGRQWVVMDAKEQVLGKLAGRIALVLRGKHKPSFTPFLDTGDFVVVINVDKMSLSGQKSEQKIYQRYSGYPGGRRTRTLDQVMETHPDRVLRQAVKGMLPTGPLARKQLAKLKIYAGAQHPHTAQQPMAVSVKG